MFANEKRWSFVRSLFLAMLALLVSAPAFGDSSSPVAATSAGGAAVEEDFASSGTVQDVTGSSGPARPLAKLSIHGYLTQAWATADFLDVPTLPNGEPAPLPSPARFEQSIGIPEDGTTNYRFLALQFRYDISAKDVWVVQLSSRTLGFSPLQEFEDEIELDWAFYERRITDTTNLKVGRIQIPVGIYNEVRDVGTLLPFYRPAFIFYREGAFTTETVDGASFAHTFAADSDWRFETTVYAGEWESVFVDIFAPENSKVVRNSKGYGVQLWLNTPLPGLRFGAGGFSREEESGIRREFLHASVDASFDRFTFQAEWSLEPEETGSPLKAKEAYALIGFGITEKLKLWAQFETGSVQFDILGFASTVDLDFRQDLAVSLNYFFAPNLVLKAEHHWVEEEDFVVTGFLPGTGVLHTNLPREDGTYSIVALAVSF